MSLQAIKTLSERITAFLEDDDEANNAIKDYCDMHMATFVANKVCEKGDDTYNDIGTYVMSQLMALVFAEMTINTHIIQL